MRVVYRLRGDLLQDPQLVKDTQALTLNAEKPLLELKGTHGLFGSEQWWRNVETGCLPLKTVTGTIEETFFAGQDARWGNEVNSFTVCLPDGSHVTESIYVNNKADHRLFRIGGHCPRNLRSR